VQDTPSARNVSGFLLSFLRAFFTIKQYKNSHFLKGF